MGSRLRVALVLRLTHGVSFEGLTIGSVDVLEPKMSCRLNRLPVGFHIGTRVGCTQSALFCGGMYFELMAYIPRASTFDFVGVPVGPLFFLPTASTFSVAISTFCVAIFSRDVVRKWVLALDSS
nr:hypothetical protein [Tanacetum cinerariifolium]